VSRPGVVLPLLRSRRRGARERRLHGVSGRTRVQPVRLCLFAVALLLVGSTAFVVWASSSGADVSFDGLDSSLLGFEVAPETTDADPGAIATLRVSSSPAGAHVRVDGASKGRTPIELRVVPAWHSVALRHTETIDDQREVEVGARARHGDPRP
jgi:hypothetical protein